MTVEEMTNIIIKVRGFEDSMTLWFCELCEKEKNLLTLNVMFVIALNAPM